MTKEFGKITAATFGFGGYQDAQFGLSLTLAGKGWGTSTGYFFWPTRLVDKDFVVKRVTAVVELLEAAKKEDVSQLVGVPVECTFDGGVLKEWRVLTEVL